MRIAGALFYEWDNVLFVHFVLLITLEGQTVASMRSLHLLNRSACQDLAATRIATLVRIAGVLFLRMGQRSLRSPCATHHS